jgi:hypothetical protein
MPRFLLLFRDDDVNMDRLSPPEFETMFQKFVTWAEKVHAEGRLAGVERLKPAAEARTVRRRSGSVVVDGPFVEGKEAVLGFFLVEAADRAEAERIAAAAPNIEIGGSVEVREVDWFPRP